MFGEWLFLGSFLFLMGGVLILCFVSGSLCCWVLIKRFFILFHANGCVVSLNTSDSFQYAVFLAVNAVLEGGEG